MPASAPTQKSAPRHEFRLFGTDLGNQAGKLATAMGESGRNRSRSLYVVWPGGADINVKLGDRALDIKRLIRVSEGFEQWRPDDERRFPLDPAAIEGLPDLGNGDVIDAATFAGRCRSAGCALVHVLKTRRHFALDGLLGEVCKLVANGCEIESIAIEGTDLASLGELRSQLGLDVTRNTSYPELLKQVTGVAPLPADSPHRAYPFG